jgi:hypothetical protein
MALAENRFLWPAAFGMTRDWEVQAIPDFSNACKI